MSETEGSQTEAPRRPEDPPPHDRRLPGETPKAWEAFCAYRDLGVGRSIDRAAAETAPPLETGSKQGQNRVSPTAGNRISRAPSHWSEWAAKFSWVERVRGYDDGVAAEADRQARAAHLARIAEHRDRRAKIGEQVSKAANALLGKGLARLMTLATEDIEPKHLPAFLRTAAAVAEAALNMEGSALGIDELLKDLEDAEDEESAEGAEAGD